MNKGTSFFFHNGWHFLLADEFPLQNALEKHCDINGHRFYEKDYIENNWTEVTLPHTFNDSDIFKNRICDSGSGQKRTVAFYRNCFEIPPEHFNQKVILEFEGIRQTCYLYVNGHLAGYCENGVAPFGFDITPYIEYGKPNLIAVATDNTATRDIDFCIAETPNKPDVEPGSYLFPQMKEVDSSRKGVGYFWNCNDFNPSLGGITRPLKIHFKPNVYLTLPLYSNLQTKGVYVYGTDYKKNTAKISVEAEIRNESRQDVSVRLETEITDIYGNHVTNFVSEEKIVKSNPLPQIPLSIVPEDAYISDPDLPGHYIPVNDESAVKETAVDSVCTSVITAVSDDTALKFWSISNPQLYRVNVTLIVDGIIADNAVIETGFRKTEYSKDKGLIINDIPVWLRGYAQRAANEWAAIGIAPEWLKDVDSMLIKESNANHIRWMHVAAPPADIRSFDRHGIVCTQPAGDKEAENHGRQWDQRVELMRDVIIYFRNNPSILFWEAGNNSINAEHMREMRKLKEKLDPHGGRFMGCRTLNTEDVVDESEYIGTMLNRHAARFLAEHGPITETEYLREEAPRRVWDDFSPPNFDYKNKWLGRGGRKQPGMDFYDLTSEDLAIASAKGYSEFFNDRIGGASKKNQYSACAALCWTDSAQHGRQAFSENARMSGRVDAVRNKKQSFDIFRTMQSPVPQVHIVGHWNYPPENGINYQYRKKEFNGTYWEYTDEFEYRNPKNKTVYVFGSYDIEKIVLEINGKTVGICDKPINTFVFPFDDINITQSGKVTAYGYDYNGKKVAEHSIITAGEPSRLNLTLHTAPGGLRADGNDIAYIDITVTDENGNICPLCFDKINFSISGNAVFLGGYNSGYFDGFGKESVIHKPYVYAECGTNRVFIRSAKTCGIIEITAQMQKLAPQKIVFESVAADLNTLTAQKPIVIYNTCDNSADEFEFVPNPKADAVKYTPEKEPYIKILVDGQEPDTRGVPSLNKNGCIWGNTLCILERLKTKIPERFEYDYSAARKELTLKSGEYTVTARAGQTHLLVNGHENLMDGEPYLTPEGQFVMEISAVVSYIRGVSARYDDKVEVFRIETN